MRIVFVAAPSDERTAAWIRQVVNIGWDVHLFPTTTQPVSPTMPPGVQVHGSTFPLAQRARRSAIWLLERWPHPRGSGHARRMIERLQITSSRELEAFIRRRKPDIVHSMDCNLAGLISVPVKARMGRDFPTWMVSNWGMDAFVSHATGRPTRSAHDSRLEQVLASCDTCVTECARDVALAQKLGLKATLLPIASRRGGYDIDRWQQFCQPVPTSQRRVILLKGRLDWSGRALAGLKAIELCADVIRTQGYSVLIQLASPDVPLAAELVAHDTGIPIMVAYPSSYEDAMRRFSVARVHMDLSVSDVMSQSLLDAMVMRTFPIHARNSFAMQWVEDGESGLLVPPEDPHLIAEALHRALTDDELVDRGVQINEETARQRLAFDVVQRQTIELYQSVSRMNGS